MSFIFEKDPDWLKTAYGTYIDPCVRMYVGALQQARRYVRALKKARRYVGGQKKAEGMEHTTTRLQIESLGLDWVAVLSNCIIPKPYYLLYISIIFFHSN